MRNYMSKKSIVVTVLLISIMVPLVNGAFDEYKQVIEIPITNGYGMQDLGDYTNPAFWDVTVTVTGWIESPQNGTWRIRILVDDTQVFDKLNITAKQIFSQPLTVGGWSRSNVKVEAWWSENANTTLKMNAIGRF